MRSSRDHLHAPAPMLKQLVTAGYLGRKTGRGIYSYTGVNNQEIADVGSSSGPSLESARPVSLIGVVGTGTMATGIVEVCAKKVAGVVSTVTRSLDKQVQRGKLTEVLRDQVLARITGTVSLDDLANCDLVIEAVVEDLAVKQALFAALDDIVREGAVLATTTSSLPVIQCAQATSRPGDVVGMHWFNPAPLMKLVEIVPTVVTSDDVTATIRAVTLRCGKHPVECGDRAGFIVNALLFPYLNDAARMLEAHYATAEDIDLAMTKGCGHPMGPFALMDVVGLDVTLAIQRTLYDEFREPGYAPAPMLEHLVTAGYLGRKTGRGFRAYAAR